MLYTRCGMEVGVAASKTFTAQAALLSLFALKLAQVRRTLPPEEIEFILDRLYELPQKITDFLDGDHPIEEIAQRFYDRQFFLYLGRHIGLPVALEGALKLKEISYIPTDAYSAGEMKHGPIALLEEGTPVVVVATNIHVYDKIVSNIQETRARGAHVIAIATDGNEDIQHHADDVIYVPQHAGVPPGGARRDPAAAARLPDRAAARAQRRPAAEPGQDRHGRVAVRPPRPFARTRPPQRRKRAKSASTAVLRRGRRWRTAASAMKSREVRVAGTRGKLTSGRELRGRGEGDREDPAE